VARLHLARRRDDGRTAARLLTDVMTATTQRSRPGLLHRVGWLLALLTVAAALLPAQSAKASNTICVALVVDFSPLGGNVDSGCTHVPSGSTGYDVLHAGGHTFEVCSNGIIGTIDNQPQNGCAIKDNTHYWGYWHRKPGSSTWSFSNYGAAVYHPGEGSTEGWVWEDGTTKPPANVPYPAGCHSPSPSPTPSPSRQSTAPAASSSPAPAASEPGRRAGSTQSTATAATRSGKRHHRASATNSSSPTPTKSPTPVASADPSSTPSPAMRLADPPAEAGNGSSRATPVLAGVGVAALLGAGAWWRVRGQGTS
jgi:hypothetical protein